MKIVPPLIAALFLSTGLAHAVEGKNPEAAAPAAEKKLTAPQQRMADCNKEAAGKKGDARRDFMRQCLHGVNLGATPAEPANMTQQSLMSQCNQQATGKRGPERRAFMSECLKKK